MAKVIESIKEIKSSGSYQYDNAVINVSEVTENGRLRGECSLSDGTVFSFSNSVPGLKARIANGGKNPSHIKKETAVTFTAKVENSQLQGTHKVISVSQSASKQEKRFRKAWKAMLQVHRVYCPEATDIPSAMFEALKQEDNWYRHVEKVKAQQAIEHAKAEAEAKAKAEAEAKAEADRLAQREADIQSLMRIMKMTREQAEAAVDAQ